MTLDTELELHPLNNLLTIMYTMVNNQAMEELSTNRWRQDKNDLQRQEATVVSMGLAWLEIRNMRQEWEMQVMGVSVMWPQVQELGQRPQRNPQRLLKQFVILVEL